MHAFQIGLCLCEMLQKPFVLVADHYQCNPNPSAWHTRPQIELRQSNSILYDVSLHYGPSYDGRLQTMQISLQHGNQRLTIWHLCTILKFSITIGMIKWHQFYVNEALFIAQTNNSIQKYSILVQGRQNNLRINSDQNLIHYWQTCGVY